MLFRCLPTLSSLSPPSISRIAAMSSSDQQIHSTDSSSENAPATPANYYPVPLSPQLPAISKEIELSRAMAASSRSSLFSLSRCHVIFEDDWLLAVDKPQGVYCDAVLASAARSDRLEPEFSTPELHLANRLDRDTSGVMLITKSHKVAAKLVKAFTEHKVKKTYLAFCIGMVPKWETITIKSGHGRSKFGAWRVYASSDVGRSLPGGSLVKDMQTFFEVLSVNGKGGLKELAEFNKIEAEVSVVEEKTLADNTIRTDEIFVRAYPQSGRTHQIRLHCQYLGISIRGDVKYEGVVEWKGKVYEGHELHAESLSFEHPVTGIPVIVRAPLPSWARDALKL